MGTGSVNVRSKTAAAMAAAMTILLLMGGISLAADSAVVNVSATILSKSNCKFRSASAVLDFGNLDPSNPVVVNTSTTIDFICRGSAPIATFLISDDDGLHETGVDANRMQHTAQPAEYIAYAFTYNPITDTVPKNADQILTITGTIQGADYQTAVPGVYADSVVLTLNP
jgi:spore coat protein U-like protein